MDRLTLVNINPSRHLDKREAERCLNKTLVCGWVKNVA
jgi:hypothetical protein